METGKGVGVMILLKKIQDFLIKCFTIFTGCLLILTITFVVFAVFDRTVFRIGLFWTEEMARTCYIWFSMCAPAIMITAGTQFACTYFVDRLLPHRAHAILNIVLTIISFVVLSILMYKGFQYVYIMRRQAMPTIPAPISLMYLSLPIGMGLMSIMSIFYIINQIYSFIHPEAGKKEEPKTTETTNVF
jgi:TRAP-type C4-dicarboxylate transport system permease small subunit